MALETGTYIDDLVATNPVAGDDISQGDDHIRLLKSTILASFPNITGAMTATEAELNQFVNSAEAYATMTCAPATSGTITVNTALDTLAQTRIGRVVHVQGSIAISANSSPVGNAVFSGLDYSIAALTEGADAVRAPVWCANFNTLADGFYLLQMTAAASTFTLNEADGTAVAPTEFVSGTSITLNFSYVAA